MDHNIKFKIFAELINVYTLEKGKYIEKEVERIKRVSIYSNICPLSSGKEEFIKDDIIYKLVRKNIDYIFFLSSQNTNYKYKKSNNIRKSETYLNHI